jgi:hypothetical protein
MIEAKKRFPTDTMLEKIAVALNKEPCELFSFSPIEKEWQQAILTKLSDFITQELNSSRQKHSHPNN